MTYPEWLVRGVPISTITTTTTKTTATNICLFFSRVGEKRPVLPWSGPLASGSWMVPIRLCVHTHPHTIMWWTEAMPRREFFQNWNSQKLNVTWMDEVETNGRCPYAHRINFSSEQFVLNSEDMKRLHFCTLNNYIQLKQTHFKS